MGMQETSEYNGSAMRKMAWCGAIAIVVVATTWWAIDGSHRPGWYVVVSGLAVMGMYLAGIFLWHWFCRALCWMGNLAFKLPDKEGQNGPETECPEE